MDTECDVLGKRGEVGDMPSNEGQPPRKRRGAVRAVVCCFCLFFIDAAHAQTSTLVDTCSDPHLVLSASTRRHSEYTLCCYCFLYIQPRPDDNPAFSLLSRCSLDDAGPDALVGDALYEHLDGLLRGHFVFSGLSMRFRTQVYAQFVREVFYRGA
jgi:hypothetical protein